MTSTASEAINRALIERAYDAFAKGGRVLGVGAV